MKSKILLVTGAPAVGKSYLVSKLPQDMVIHLDQFGIETGGRWIIDFLSVAKKVEERLSKSEAKLVILEGTSDNIYQIEDFIKIDMVVTPIVSFDDFRERNRLRALDPAYNYIPSWKLDWIKKSKFSDDEVAAYLNKFISPFSVDVIGVKNLNWAN